MVHCVGGVAAFVGAVIIGPRLGRFHEESSTTINIRGHSVPFAALGGFILLFGFMAFNGGSQLTISNPGDGAVVSLAIINTVISGSMAAFISLIFHRTNFCGTQKWSLLNTLNGALTGMVSMCAGCNVIRPWGAVVVGVVGGVSFNITSWLMVRLRIDDPLDAVAVHFGGGCWGVISVAFLKYTGGSDNGILVDWDKQAGLMLGWQLAGVAAIIAWTGGVAILIFGSLRLMGILRVSAELEIKGLDIPKHGEPAYPMEAYGHGYIERILSVLEDGQLTTSKFGYQNRGFQDEKGPFESPEVNAMGVLKTISQTLEDIETQPNSGVRCASLTASPVSSNNISHAQATTPNNKPNFTSQAQVYNGIEKTSL